MSSSDERGSPLRGMRGGRDAEERSWEDGNFPLFREGRKGKRAGLRSHREVVGEAEVRAVAAKEDPPCGGCVGGRGAGRGDSFGKKPRE